SCLLGSYDAGEGKIYKWIQDYLRWHEELPKYPDLSWMKVDETRNYVPGVRNKWEQIIAIARSKNRAEVRDTVRQRYVPQPPAPVARTPPPIYGIGTPVAKLSPVPSRPPVRKPRPKASTWTPAATPFPVTSPTPVDERFSGVIPTQLIEAM